MAYIGKQPIVGNFVKLDAITTSATATYNLLNGGVAYFPQSANNCIVSLNGVIQSPTSAYTISGSTIVFSDALTSSDTIDFILVLGDVLSIGTPSDGTVGFAKVTSNLITGATAETSIAGGDSVLIYDDSAAALRKMTRTNFVSGIGGTNTPAFFAYKSSTQSISANSTVKVTFDTERFDTDNAFASSTFTVPSGKDGKYVFIMSVRFNDVASSGFFIKIFKNGSQLDVDGQVNVSASSYNNQLRLVSILDLSASDYIEMYSFQSGGTPVIQASSDGYYMTTFQGFKLI